MKQDKFNVWFFIAVDADSLVFSTRASVAKQLGTQSYIYKCLWVISDKDINVTDWDSIVMCKKAPLNILVDRDNPVFVPLNITNVWWSYYFLYDSTEHKMYSTENEIQDISTTLIDNVINNIFPLNF